MYIAYQDNCKIHSIYNDGVIHVSVITLFILKMNWNRNKNIRFFDYIQSINSNVFSRISKLSFREITLVRDISTTQNKINGKALA